MAFKFEKRAFPQQSSHDGKKLLRNDESSPLVSVFFPDNVCANMRACVGACFSCVIVVCVVSPVSISRLKIILAIGEVGTGGSKQLRCASRPFDKIH